MNSIPRRTTRSFGLLLSFLSVIFFSHAFAASSDSVWVRIHNGADDPRLAEFSQRSELMDYGTFQWGELAGSMKADLQDQGLNASVIDDPFMLDLGGMVFDPLTDFPEGKSTMGGSAGDFHLVQFQGPIRSEWLSSLRSGNVKPIQYIHPFTYIVWAEQSQLNSVQDLDGVRWTGHYLPEFRVLPQQLGLGSEMEPTNLLVSRHVDMQSLTSQLESLGVEVLHTENYLGHFKLLETAAPGDVYMDLGRVPAVYTVQQAQPMAPRTEMSNQSIVGNYGPAPDHELFPGYADWLTDTGYDGSGVTVGIIDGGVRGSHQDLVDNMVDCVSQGSPTSCTSSNSNHGTHVAGAVGGSGASGTTDSAGFLRGQGVAPGAGIVEQRYGSPGLSYNFGSQCSDTDSYCTTPSGMLVLFKEAALSGATHANNSWGSTGIKIGYDLPTQQVDVMTRDATPDNPMPEPVLPVWSIMNGYGDSAGACNNNSLGSPDEAKNLFAVGSTWMQPSVGQQYSNIFDVSDNSAHGPACDGRVGVHIVAPGCSTDAPSGGSNSAYQTMCGTSMASPVASGAIAVFIEMYRDLFEDATPSPAMIKAAFMAEAMNLHGFENADGGEITETPSRFQGYGRIDLDAVVNPENDVMYFDQETVLSETGEEWSLPLMAVDPSEPVRVMMVFTDAYGHGLAGTTPAWVNDLDLTVAVGDDLYLGNQIGSDGFSQTGGSADSMNNMEAVFLRDDQHSGQAFDVTVVAANIAADAINPHDPGDEGQDFALVCYNCQFGDPAFTIDVEPESVSVCLPESGSVDVNADLSIGVVGAYSGNVALSADHLPAGVSESFDPASVEAPGTSVLTLSVDESAETGSSDLEIIGDDGDESLQAPLNLLLESAPDAIELTEPQSGALEVALQPQFSWVGQDGVDDYRIQVSLDADFTSPLIDEWVSSTSFVPETELELGTDYYWRVQGQDHCGEGEWSDVWAFQTRFDPVADFQPTQLEFEVNTGLSDQDEVTIENIGTGVLNWSASTVTCEDGKSFDWISIHPGSGNVSADQVDTLQISVDTTGLAIGEHVGEVCVTTNQADAEPFAIEVLLEVLDLPPAQIELTTTLLAFGEVPTGQAGVLELGISNMADPGSADLQIEQIEVISGQSQFDVISTDCPEALPVDESCTAEVEFRPSELGAQSGVLRVRADGQSNNIALQGRGVEPEPEIFGDRFETVD